MVYKIELLNHLSNYKNEILGIKENGIWLINKKEYTHILPLDLKELNILETYKEVFWEYCQSININLHQDFHHLNSSQAMCFNLFAPFVLNNKIQKLIFMFLNIHEFEITEMSYEKILDKREKTNFDFYISGKEKQVVFEIKLSENSFSKISVKDRLTDKYISKLNNIYKPRLSKILKEDYINSDFIFDNYQLLRNISYLDSKTDLFIIIPKRNNEINKDLENCNNILKPEYELKVHVIFLEKIINTIIGNVNNKLLNDHFKLMKEKYIFETEE